MLFILLRFVLVQMSMIPNFGICWLGFLDEWTGELAPTWFAQLYKASNVTCFIRKVSLWHPSHCRGSFSFTQSCLCIGKPWFNCWEPPCHKTPSCSSERALKETYWFTIGAKGQKTPKQGHSKLLLTISRQGWVKTSQNISSKLQNHQQNRLVLVLSSTEILGGATLILLCARRKQKKDERAAWMGKGKVCCRLFGWFSNLDDDYELNWWADGWDVCDSTDEPRCSLHICFPFLSRRTLNNTIVEHRVSCSLPKMGSC